MTISQNAEIGLTIEEDVCERWPLRRIDDHGDPNWRDAEFQVDYCDSRGIPIVRGGTPVEIKSCRARLDGRNGRWWIARDSHERLLEADGEYALVVRDDNGVVERMALASAATVDALIDTWWSAGDGGKQVREYRQLAWTAVFNALDRGERA